MPEENNDVEQLADSLVSLGRATATLKRFDEDLMLTLETFEKNSQVRRFLADPAIRVEGKLSAVREILKDRVHPVLLHFLLILVEQDIISKLKPVADSFFRKVSGLRQRISGELVTALPLPPEKIAAIEKETGAILDKEVHLRVRVDPDILGGVFVQVGDFVLDGTIDHRLDSIRRQLLA